MQQDRNHVITDSTNGTSSQMIGGCINSFSQVETIYHIVQFPIEFGAHFWYNPYQLRLDHFPYCPR